jgi:hypothetical protein
MMDDLYLSEGDDKSESDPDEEGEKTSQVEALDPVKNN